MDKETLLKVALVSFCLIGTVLAVSLLARAAWIGASALFGFGG